MKNVPTTQRPLTDDDGQVRELTSGDFALFKPIPDVGSDMIDLARRGRGRPTISQPKVHIGFRLPADVVEGIRSKGRGYTARVEKVLRAALASGDL